MRLRRHDRACHRDPPHPLAALAPAPPARGRRGLPGCALTIAFLTLLASCYRSVTVKDDEFGNVVRFVGASGTVNPFMGTKAEYHLVSFVGKTEPYAVEHRVEATFYYEHDVPTQQFVLAADDRAQELPLARLFFGSCGFKPYCLKQETVGIAVADGMLRQRALSGYRIKVSSRSGDQKILELTPAMLIQQLNTVDARLDRGNHELGADKPHLGIGAIGVDEHPYDGSPRGMIVVQVASGSPAEVAGVRPGDIVTAFGGHPIRTFSDVVGTLDTLSRGQAILLELQRDGKPVATSVRL